MVPWNDNGVASVVDDNEGDDDDEGDEYRGDDVGVDDVVNVEGDVSIPFVCRIVLLVLAFAVLLISVDEDEIGIVIAAGSVEFCNVNGSKMPASWFLLSVFFSCVKFSKDIFNPSCVTVVAISVYVESVTSF